VATSPPRRPPEEMRQKVAGDMARWRKVIDTAGIRVE
jgi:hypothetical protein